MSVMHGHKAVSGVVPFAFDRYTSSTRKMLDVHTHLTAGWDFVGETANGTEDIWWILEGKDHPRLWWEPIDDCVME